MTRKDGGRGSLDFTTEGLNEAPPRVSQDVPSDSEHPRERPHITFSPSTNDVPHSQRSPPPPSQQPHSPRRPRGNSLRTQLFERHRQQQQQQQPVLDTTNDTSMDTSGEYSWATDPSEEDLKEGPYQREDRFEDVTPQDIDKSIDDAEPLARASVDSKRLSRMATQFSTTPGNISERLPNYALENSKPNSFMENMLTWGPQKKVAQAFGKVHDFVLNIQHLPPSQDGRQLPLEVPTGKRELLDERRNKKFIDNEIKSSIYTPWSFLPRQLYAQFSKLANLYFLAVSIMQMIPSWSTTGTYTTIAPLMFFICVSMAREGYDDWRRHRQDKAENYRLAKVAIKRDKGGTISESSSSRNMELDSFSSGDSTTGSAPIEFKEVYWKDIMAGDIVKLKQNDWIPADMIVLWADGMGDQAYIETMALDGETNLKPREALPLVQKQCSTDAGLAKLNGHLNTEDPNIDLYNFEGRLEFQGVTYSLGPQNVVYRGSILRNTPNMLGVVIFTGEETKIRMNAIKNPRTKAPRLQTMVNKIVMVMVAFVLILSAFCTGASSIYYHSDGRHMWYLKGLEVGVVPNLMGFIIMYNTLIPLSLYVALEIVKVFQIYFIQSDIDMYHIPSNTPCEAHTATINEELGQVSYIFTDKTGTLTENLMVFRKLSVGGRAWIHELDCMLEAAKAANAVKEARNSVEMSKLAGKAGVGDMLIHKPRRSRKSLRKSMGSMKLKKKSIDPFDASQDRRFDHKNSGGIKAWDGRDSDDSVRKDWDDNGASGSNSRPSNVRSMGRPSNAGGRPSVVFDRTAEMDHESRPRKSQGIQSIHSPRQSTDELFRQVMALPRKSMTMEPTHTHNSEAEPRLSRALSTRSQWKASAAPMKDQENPTTLDLLNYLQTNPNSEYSRRAKFFLLNLALCHMCLPEGDLEEGIEYTSASPDEVALVAAARDLGYIMSNRYNSTVTVRTFPDGLDDDPVDETYEILDVIEFTSGRKRMSVVVRMPNNELFIFCKGADNVIVDRLRNSAIAHEKIDRISNQAADRKRAEAEVVLESRKSMGAAASPRKSGVEADARTSFGIPRPSINLGRSRDPLDSIDDWLYKKTREEEDVHEVASTARKSVQLARKRMYNEPQPRRSMDVRQTAPRASMGRISTGRVSFAYGEERLPRNMDDLLTRTSPKKNNGDNFEEEDAAGDLSIEFGIDDELVKNDAYIMEKTLNHIEEFSTEGLRTLMYAHKKLGEEEYKQWKKLYDDARTSLENRAIKCEKVGEMIERDFELSGATAIEDKLQKGVPEAIEKLRRANIRLWMLTGDKRETAINIGYSCRLIKDYSTVVILKHDEDIVGALAQSLLKLDTGNVAHCVVVVDGQTLSVIEEDLTLMSLFIDLGIKADSVICCRASPSQKALMVTNVRSKVKSAITLAIGDGANDIAMIQSADVGIGITGKEGLQAARSADFAIAQFSYLLKLLLVHGHWNYDRTCKYVLATFYKEMLFYTTQAIFQYNSMFTGTSMYEQWSLAMFNTLFTSLPVIVLGIFEQDLSAATLIAIPELYAKGQKNEAFNYLVYLVWMTIAISQSLIISFMAFYIWGFSSLPDIDNTLYPLGMITFTAVVLLITLKLQMMDIQSRTVIALGVTIISIGGWFAWNLFLSAVYHNGRVKIYYIPDGMVSRWGRDLSWWAALLVVTVAAALVDILWKVFRVWFFPTDTDLFQELEQDDSIKKRLEEEAYEELQQGWRHGNWVADLEAQGADSPGTPRSSRTKSTRYSNSVRSPTSGRYYDEYTPYPSSSGRESSFMDHPSRADRLRQKLRFPRKKTSGEYEREVEEILKRRAEDERSQALRDIELRRMA
ncbi:putative phospholipid-transporting ATPase DNF3 [Yarrowia sp. C11]|nr:putative phospholipid-transporting ATPase DNF3 [Yarrowia sp. C11]